MTITSTIGHFGAFQKATPDMPTAPKGDFWATFTAGSTVEEGSVNDPKVDIEVTVEVPRPRLQQENEVVDGQQERPLDELFPTLAASAQPDVSHDPVPSEFGDVFQLGTKKNDAQLLDVDHKSEPRTEAKANEVRADTGELRSQFLTLSQSRHNETSQPFANNPPQLRTELKIEGRGGTNPPLAQNAKSEPEIVGKGGMVEVSKETLGPVMKSEVPIGQFMSGKDGVWQNPSHETVLRGLVQSEPQQIARLVKNPETDKTSNIPTIDAVAEMSSQKTQIPITEAVNGRDIPRDRLSVETGGGQDIGHNNQVASTPRHPITPALQFELASDSSLTIQVDPDTIGNGFSLDRTYGPSASAAPLNVPPHQQTSVAASVSQQISVAVGNKPDGLTEIALNPEELGSVRISVKTHEGAVVLIIAAERAETQELMRKNIEALSQEFKSLGFTDIGFQFQGHGQGREQGENAEPANSPHQSIETAGEIVAAEREQIAKDGLDLRL